MVFASLLRFYVGLLTALQGLSMHYTELVREDKKEGAREKILRE